MNFFYFRFQKWGKRLQKKATTFLIGRKRPKISAYTLIPQIQ